MYSVNLFTQIAESMQDGRVWAVSAIRERKLVWKIVFTADEVLYSEPAGLDVDQVCTLDKQGHASLLDLWRTKMSAESVRDGDQTILLESFGRRKQLVICGAGHVALNLIRIAKIVGFNVISLEDRPMFADMATAAGADEVICDAFDKGLARIDANEDTCFIVMTRGHRFDEICLRSIFRMPYAYVGMMGSRGRTVNVKHDLEKEGYETERLDDLHAPIGLDIKAQTPTEIAVSVAGELIEYLRSHDRAIDDGIEGVIRGAGDEDMASMHKVIATIVSKRGETPRTIGTKMLVLENGQLVGTIGGGCAEAEVITQARAMIQEARDKGAESVEARLCDVDLTPAQGNSEDSMFCGGLQEILLETVAPV